MNSTVMVRAFVALELSEEIRADLAKAQEILRTGSSRLSYVDPAIIHITVKFLGEVPAEKIAALSEALSSVRVAPFTASAGPLTVNNPRRPHTVWSAISDDGSSRELFRQVEDALAPLGFLRETRPFTPHATVARVKDADLSLLKILDGLKTDTYGTCMISGLKLKKSTLTPKGPLYEDLFGVKW